MCGGYYSFAGMYGAAKYYRTVVEEVLPVTIHPFDDRAETPEGVQAEIVPPDHPIVAGLRRRGRHCWASTRSYQAGRHADRHGGRPPLLAAHSYGQGASLVWTSDIGPHWCPEPFVTWQGAGCGCRPSRAIRRSEAGVNQLVVHLQSQ